MGYLHKNFVKKNVLCGKGDKITRFDGTLFIPRPSLKVHKNKKFFGFDFEFCPISLLFMHE
jgi:hypothetical protein